MLGTMATPLGMLLIDIACAMQFMTYAAYRLQLESAFLADELSSAAAAKQDLRTRHFSNALLDTGFQEGKSGKGSQPEDTKTEPSSAQVCSPQNLPLPITTLESISSLGGCLQKCQQ